LCTFNGLRTGATDVFSLAPKALLFLEEAPRLKCLLHTTFDKADTTSTAFALSTSP
jgi:hypothetical protein